MISFTRYYIAVILLYKFILLAVFDGIIVYFYVSF